MEVEAIGDSYKIRRSSGGRGLAERVHAAKLKLDAERILQTEMGAVQKHQGAGRRHVSVTSMQIGEEGKAGPMSLPANI